MARPNAAVQQRKSDKVWRDAVMRAVARRESKKDPQALEKLADSLVAKGLDGDVSALKEIGDRLDGKPAQALEHSGRMSLTVEIVKFAGSASE